MDQFCAYEATFITVKRVSAPVLRAKSAESFRRVQRDGVHGYVADLESRALCRDFLKVPLPPRVEAEAPSAGTVGSLGHPEFCHKPCLFALSRCPNGAACNFCHKDHGKLRKLSKQQRELLRQLGEAERLALILPLLRAKDLPEADGLLTRLETHLYSLTATPSAAPTWKILQLRRALGQLSFRRLLLLSETTAWALGELLELQAQVGAA
ncbi:unnamed protein product [Effrenium voratum]|uniref:C3H1-type domain-containing protein n=1 Tax=Effrenium voratum TaxID=2562239 RepID=A0AA36JQI9_9DINO|nr:unnamed protein product [Effrenium voratum]CAJ1442316.1 unnamed protein product [Effrenium voratum]